MHSRKTHERSKSGRRIPALLLGASVVTLCAMTGPSSPSFAASLDRRAVTSTPGGDWPQLGHDPQRTNDSPVQVDPPYCYTWKWYEAPIASRAQPVVADGRLFVGAMDGYLYARDAATGAPQWKFASGGPIRHSPGVAGATLVFSSHDGFTYALEASSGELKWKTYTGPSATAPLLDDARDRVYVGSTDGLLTALDLTDGTQAWQADTGAPILTSPSLSSDGTTVFLGNEDVTAIALRASDGVERWRTALQGQSLAERYPVVVGDSVIYRSQPIYSFHRLLHEGDDVMDQAGAVDPDWSADWSEVRPKILSYLTDQPAKQTFFVLDASDGRSRGVAPVLYTYGNNDIPSVPVVRGGELYLAYRARHGIQTDGGGTHVTSRYDAELGRMDLTTLDILGLRQANYPTYNREFRLTSDEPTMLTMGGEILWADNWERVGGLNLRTGELIHVGGVSNDWPECYAQCSPGTPNPFFPLSGKPSDPAYPFPSPRVTEGHARGGLVVASGMLYWRVIEGGVAGISHRDGDTCPTPQVWLGPSTGQPSPAGSSDTANLPRSAAAERPLTEYVSLDLTTPVSDPPGELVHRLREEVRAITSANDHLTPFYLERGFSQPFLWPYDVFEGKNGLPAVTYGSTGNVYWHDPGELLYTLALAYPYLDPPLQAEVRAYLAAEMERFPPLENLPYNDGQRDWLRKGTPREPYAVPFRSGLNSWPPPAANMSALYALWLWSKNSDDWSYAQAHWDQATALFEARRNGMRYYADIAGAIGYARMAAHFGYSEAQSNGVQAAVGAMEAGRDFQSLRQRAETEYLDPRDDPTGWYVPVFYGMTPEVGLYLREQTGGEAARYLAGREEGDGLRWWYLTRAGAHAEVGESSYAAPIAAWSHFLAHAYVLGEPQETLRQWLDRPWGRGDLYSIQKIVATIHASKGNLPTPTFVDVPFDHPYHDQIEALYQAGYTAGCATNPLRYCPDQAMTRSESAVFVERGLHGVEVAPPDPVTSVFEDLQPGYWGLKWATALWDDSYTAGCGTDPLRFCPERGHTRAEGAVFYLRMLHGVDYFPPDPQGIFADVPVGWWGAKWAEAAYGAGLIEACGEAPLRFCPDDPLTRGLAASMMVQAKGLQAH